MMMLKRKSVVSALLAVVLLGVVVTTAEAKSSHVGPASAASFRPQSRVSLVKQQEKFQTPLVEKEVNKNLAIRGGVANSLPNAFGGALVFGLIEIFVKKGLKRSNIKFPGQLAGCIWLFAFLLITEAVSSNLANDIFYALTPGAGLLSKWLPVFFVPGLVMLPTSPSIGSSFEILKVLLVVSLGFVFTLTTTTFAVVGVRTATGGMAPQGSGGGVTSSAKSIAKGPLTKPFSDQTATFFSRLTLFSGILSILATRDKHTYRNPLQTLFLGSYTVSAYVWGARLSPSFTKLVHPLVTSSGIILASIALLAKVTGKDFHACLRTYRVGSLGVMKAGPGDILLYLLGPSVVSFAISMYSRRDLLKKNLLVVITAMLVSSFGGLFGTAAFVRLISLGGKNGRMVRLSVLARNVTTALSMALTQMLGGDISIAASVVVLTGIIGATYGKSFLTAMGITDPICRGLGIGSSSQGLGVASIADEPDAFPFAAIGMVLTAISATTIGSIPVLKDALIKLATGK